MKNFVFLTIILFSNWALGQDKAAKSFSGNFEDGTATYSYYENDNYERIYNGKFAYSASVVKYDGLKININGSFIENQRDGLWIFSVKNVKSPVWELLSDMDKAIGQMGLQLAMQLGASEDKILEAKEKLQNKIVYQTYNSILKGNYIAGKMDGLWTFNETFTGAKEPIMGYTHNKINKPISTTVSFKDNKLIDNFIFKQDEKNYVLGQFDDNGILTGKWIIKWVSKKGEFENIREYENGFLIKMIERNVSTGDILFRDNKTDGEGRGIMAGAILFWLRANGKNDINGSSISDRNYMYSFDRGIIKPVFEYNF